MSVDVLAFVEDPGAANYVVPVVAALKGRGLSAELRVAPALSEYVQRQTGHSAIVAEGGAAELLSALDPRAIFVGTSENPRTLGLALIDEAKRRRIVAVAAIDAPSNARARFRGDQSAPLAHAPDHLIVPDQATAVSFSDLGFPAATTHVCGHPHYDVVRERAAALKLEGRQAVRARTLMVAAHRPVIVFAGEVSTGLDPEQYRRSAAYSLHGSGTYDLRTEIVLEEFLAAVETLAPRPYLVLRLHPKNTRDELAPFVGAFDETSAGGSPLDLLFAADAVVGMTSILLFEAALMERPALAILPRAAERAWLGGWESNLIATATTSEDIRSGLRSVLARRATSSTHLPPAGATDRAADVIAALLS